MHAEHAVASEIGGIQSEIIAAIAADELVYPSMPWVSLRVREVAEDADVPITSICDVIASEAAMAARIIKVANSPLFRGVKEVDNLKIPVTRMGTPYTYNLAVGVPMDKLYQSTFEDVDRPMRVSLAHSTWVAFLFYTYRRHFTRKKPDQAALAGLVHEIGKLPLLMRADADEVEVELRSCLLQEWHAEIGVHILTRWDFPVESREIRLGTIALIDRRRGN